MLEPRASRPARRLAAIKALAEGGVPVGYLQAPDDSGSHRFGSSGDCAGGGESGRDFFRIRRVALAFCREALFEQWLNQHYPDKKQKILNRVREIRGGKLNDPNFKTRMRGEGIYAEQMARVVSASAEEVRYYRKMAEAHDGALSQAGKDQLSLF